MAFNKYGKLSVAMVNQLNGLLGIDVPQDYKDFLINTNGGRFDFEDEHYIFFEKQNKKIWIDVFYGNKENKRSSLMFWNKEYSDEIPENAIIIGDTQDHGFLVYICSGDTKGIYFWDDLFSIDGSSSEGKNAYFVANDMNELLKKINVSIKKFCLGKTISNIDKKIGQSNILYKEPDGNKMQVIDAIVFKRFMHPCDEFII